MKFTYQEYGNATKKMIQQQIFIYEAISSNIINVIIKPLQKEENTN